MEKYDEILKGFKGFIIIMFWVLKKALSHKKK